MATVQSWPKQETAKSGGFIRPGQCFFIKSQAKNGAKEFFSTPKRLWQEFILTIRRIQAPNRSVTCIEDCPLHLRESLRCYG